MDLDGAWRRRVADLIRVVQDSDLSHLEIEHGAFSLRVERDLAPAPLSVGAAMPASVPAAEAVPGPVFLRSPQVGTFYLSAEPQSEPFVREGSVVEPGQVIGLIEAMKLISEVEAETGGTVRHVLVEDGQAVEYGQPLYELE